MEVFQNSEDLWEQVVKKFNKTIKSLDEDVSLLAEWLKSQPHLPTEVLDCNCFRNFLLLSEFNMEAAKQKIENYFTLRINFEETYGKCNPQLEFNELLCKTAFMVAYPKLTKEMYRIGYFKMKNKDLLHLYEAPSPVKRLVTIQDLRLRTDVMCGDVVVADFKDVTFAAALKITPPLIYRSLKLYEEIYSMPLKAVYIMNLPLFAAFILSLVKKLLKPQLAERIHIIKDADEIRQVLPLDLLPKDFGGEGPSLAMMEEGLLKLYEENLNLFLLLDKMEII